MAATVQVAATWILLPFRCAKALCLMDVNAAYCKGAATGSKWAENCYPNNMWTMPDSGGSCRNSYMNNGGFNLETSVCTGAFSVR